MDNNTNSSFQGLSTPPEGVIAGESIPRENEQDDWTETEIQRVVGQLKGRGKPYTKWSNKELRRKARKILRGAND